MFTLDAASAETLAWCQPERDRREFELRRGEEVRATLRMEAGPAVSWALTNPVRALAAAAGCQWNLSLTRRGFLGVKGDIHVAGADTGVLQAGFFLVNGRLRLDRMPELRWVGGVARTSSDHFEDMQGSTVLRLDHGDFFERVNARVSVLSSVLAPRVVSVLACLGLYMRLIMNRTHR